MDGTHRELLQSREILSPNDTNFFQRPDHLSSTGGSFQESLLGCHRSLNDAIGVSNSSRLEIDGTSILSKSVNESTKGAFFSGVDHFGPVSPSKYTKLEPDELCYTTAVNPNEITKDKTRRKNSPVILNTTTLDSNSQDLSSFQMDPTNLSTNPSPSFNSMEPPDNTEFISLDGADCNFGSYNTLANTQQTSTSTASSFSTNFRNNDFFEKDSLLNANNELCRKTSSSSRKTIFNLDPVVWDFDESVALSGASDVVQVPSDVVDDTSMDTSLIEDVSSSSELPHNWQSDVGQVCLGVTCFLSLYFRKCRNILGEIKLCAPRFHFKVLM